MKKSGPVGACAFCSNKHLRSTEYGVVCDKCCRSWGERKPWCPVCGSQTVEYGQKAWCPGCHIPIETCCEGGKA